MRQPHWKKMQGGSKPIEGDVIGVSGHLWLVVEVEPAGWNRWRVFLSPYDEESL
jgi:hypothetical protein